MPATAAVSRAAAALVAAALSAAPAALIPGRTAAALVAAAVASALVPAAALIAAAALSATPPAAATAALGWHAGGLARACAKAAGVRSANARSLRAGYVTGSSYKSSICFTCSEHVRSVRCQAPVSSLRTGRAAYLRLKRAPPPALPPEALGLHQALPVPWELQERRRPEGLGAGPGPCPG